jgi:uncharacterized protein
VDEVRLLERAKRIAVVGCSPKADRDSYQIAQYLIDHGYEVFPVNPGHDRILDRPCTPTIPPGMDIACVFRRPEHMPAVVEDAIQAGAKCVWMQLDTGNPEAADRARAAGLDVVYERCIRTVHSLFVRQKPGGSGS